MTLKLKGAVMTDAVKKFFDMDEGITSGEVNDYLYQNKDDEVEIEIDSQGGDVFVGIDICNSIRSHGNVTAIIKSRAFSAAAVIVAGAKKIKIFDNATLLVHNASTTVMGNAKDLRKTADDLDTIDKALVQTFKNRFKGTDEELKNLMNEDRFLTAQEALDYGLVDEIISNVDETEQIQKIIENHREINNKFVFRVLNKTKGKEPAQSISKPYLNFKR